MSTTWKRRIDDDLTRHREALRRICEEAAPYLDATGRQAAQGQLSDFELHLESLLIKFDRLDPSAATEAKREVSNLITAARHIERHSRLGWAAAGRAPSKRAIIKKAILQTGFDKGHHAIEVAVNKALAEYGMTVHPKAIYKPIRQLKKEQEELQS